MAATAINNAQLFNSEKLSAKELKLSYRNTLNALSAALDMRDNDTRGHSKRVSLYTLALAEGFGGLTETEKTDIENGALLHDIGKIGIPDSILLKPGKLTEEEWVIMKKHSELGYNTLKNVNFLKGAIPIVLSHHERWDGSEYPKQLKQNDIPLGARLFAIADTLDAMTCNRPYRKALSFEVACEEIKKNCGTQFDPKAVELFLSIPKEKWTHIKENI